MVKIAIKEDCIDLYLLERVREETAINLGFQIIEVPQGMASKNAEDCKLVDFDNVNGKFEFNRQRYEERLLNEKERELKTKRLNALENWFNNYFDKQLIQSQWQDNFKVSHDDYFDKDYADINELKAQAEIVRQEIKNLREVMLGVEEDADTI